MLCLSCYVAIPPYIGDHIVEYISPAKMRHFCDICLSVCLSVCQVPHFRSLQLERRRKFIFSFLLTLWYSTFEIKGQSHGNENSKIVFPHIIVKSISIYTKVTP